VEDVDERRNKSSGSMGWASRSESPSKSESGGTNDFLRRGDGVSTGELYLRKLREEALREKRVGDGGCGCAENEKSGGSYHISTASTPAVLNLFPFLGNSCLVGISSTIKDHVIASIT
jgi:hypothetical protein